MKTKPKKKAAPVADAEEFPRMCPYCLNNSDSGHMADCDRPKKAPPAPPKKFYRVTWIEKYEKVFEAETEDAAIENRDDDDAFQGCEESSAQEVVKCYVGPGVECGGCKKCENGWLAVAS